MVWYRIISERTDLIADGEERCCFQAPGLAHLYAVSAFLSDGTETFLSAMARNDDRDHNGLMDEEETVFGSDMNNPDTDGDGKIGMAGAIYAMPKVVML